jgi:hypothetical protein
VSVKNLIVLLDFLLYCGISFFVQQSHRLSRALYRVKYLALNSDTVSDCAPEANVVSERSVFMIIILQEGEQA